MDERAPGGSDWPEPPPASPQPAAPEHAAPAVRVEYDPPPASPAPAYPASYYPPGYAPPGALPEHQPAAIHVPTYAGAPPPRSGTASAIGTLGIIFGSLIALGSGLQVGCRALVQGLQAPAARTGEITRLLQLEMGVWGMMTLMSLALIVIGIGVWRHREIARKAMLVWSVLALLVVGGRVATEALVLQPQAVKHQRALLEPRENAPAGPSTEHLIRVGQTVSLGATVIIWAPFPLLALVLLTRPKVRERCS
jgi:hypothetical protein